MTILLHMIYGFVLTLLSDEFSTLIIRLWTQWHWYSINHLPIIVFSGDYA